MTTPDVNASDLADHHQWGFSGTFRSYQQRILDRYEDLVADQRIHIVAAPGSGKTILGLEFICRLAAPALVLAPTITIRDQWIDRFATHFQNAADPQADPRAWCSTSLHHPAHITVITYQALFSAYTRALDEETGEDFADVDVLAAVTERGITTICMDEAHHLRAQWHRALTAFMDSMRATCPELTTIALTATPPYDSTPAQWERYEELCGPIDEEIFAPELVATGDLCPHQDYVYVTEPNRQERAEIAQLRERGVGVIASLIASGSLRQIAADLVRLTDTQVQEALDDEDSFYALIRLLTATDQEVPRSIRALFTQRRPELADELGLQFILDHSDMFTSSAVDEIRGELVSANLLDGNKISVTGELKVNRLLTQSAGKIRAVSDIAEEEVNGMGERLRMVVLADHVRREYLTSLGREDSIVHMGVIPLFEALRRRVGHAARIAALTGSVIVIPRAALNEITQYAAELGGEVTQAKDVTDDYLQVAFSGGTRVSVPVMTKSFEEGLFTVLVGTAALLGEGWDSPRANALIMASSVRAFMLTNQMRGRVIRIDPLDPDKTANIWHIATCDVVEEGLIADHLNRRAGEGARVLASHDVRSLMTRFEAFVAPRADIPVIENGFERCFDKPPEEAYHRIADANETMMNRAYRRDEMRAQWAAALADGNYPDSQPFEMQLKVETEQDVSAGVFPYLDVIVFAVLVVLFSLGIGATEAGTRLVSGPLAQTLVIAGTLLVGGLATWMRMRSVAQITGSERRLRAEAIAVARTLKELGIISSETLAVEVDMPEYDPTRRTRLRLSGGTFSDRQQFATAMRQLCGPITNARYLITPAHRIKIRGIFFAQSVPDAIGLRRQSVDIFISELEKMKLPMQAIYTRNPEGRDFLLKARRRSGSNIAARITRQSRRYARQLSAVTKLFGEGGGFEGGD